jgi:hypothetical protein
LAPDWCPLFAPTACQSRRRPQRWKGETTRPGLVFDPMAGPLGVGVQREKPEERLTVPNVRG